MAAVFGFLHREDRLLAVAAGVVFYGLLAVFPAITALVSLYGLFASSAAIGDHLSLAAGILPQGAVDIPFRATIQVRGRITKHDGLGRTLRPKPTMAAQLPGNS